MIMEELEEMSTTDTTFLPEEIVIEILSWLPAKSLLTSFKLVCKAFRNLIEDPDFIKIHLNRGAIHGGSSLIRKPRFGNTLFQLHPRLNCVLDQPPFTFKDIPIAVVTNLDLDVVLPLISSLAQTSKLTSTSRLVGSCNGLLCLSLDYNEHIVLLNPATRKYKISPKRPIKCPVRFKFGYVTYGFGCFTTTTIDEYRVVRIACFYPHGNDDDDNPPYAFKMDIYSMSSNSWRWVTDIPPRKRFGHQSSGVFLNGVVHWMGCNHGYNNLWDTIVSFNIEDEAFRQIPMAPCDINNSDDVILMNWRGYLGMIYCSRNGRMDIDLEIWVMKEYGIGESWTKEFVIRTSDSDPLGGELPAGFSVKSRRIMTCFWTGDQILIQGIYELIQRHVCAPSNQWRIYGRLVLYDMNWKKINKIFLLVDIPSEPRDEQTDYIDTLVSLNSSLLPLNKQ